MQQRPAHPRSLIKGVGEIDGIREYRGAKILSIAESLWGESLDATLFTIPFAVDVFYALFLPAPSIDYESLETGPGEEAEFRLSTLTALLSSPSYRKIKTLTTADSTTSIVAAASFIERLARLLSSQAPPTSGRGGGEGEQSEGLSNIVEKALRQAVHDASVAKDLKNLVTRTTAGMASGTESMLSYGDDPERILRLARNTNVERILRIVMGVKVSFTPLSRIMRRHSRGWLGGLEYGSDLERIHYSQLALPDEIFLSRLADSKLLLYEKQLPASKGPMYVLLDKSGSMIGEKIDWARAVAVALLEKSMRENRPFYVRFFDSTVYPLTRVRKAPHSTEILQVLEYLATVRAGGGTDITGALVTALGDIAAATRGDRVGDIVLITDGEDRIDVDRVMRSRSAVEARIISVMIQGHNNYLKRISEHYLTVRKLETKPLLEVVELA